MIYCNGDSFVRGDELGDTIFPNHPGWMDYDPPDEIKYKFQEWKSSTHDPNKLGNIREQNWNLIRVLQTSRAWPKKLEKLLGKTVINRSESGASMDRIARTTVSDLLILTKKTRDITVIIGTTGAARFETGWAENMQYLWRCIIPQWIDDERVGPVIKYKLINESDYHNFINFYKNIIYIKDFCAIHGLKLYFIKTPNALYPDESILNNQDLKDMIKYADVKYELSMGEVAARINKGVLCPDGHFSEIVHQEVANMLYKRLSQ